MPFSLDPDLIENNDVKITTNASNDFVLEHKITGNTLTLGSDGTLDVDSLSTDDVGITKTPGTLSDLDSNLLAGGETVAPQKGTYTLTSKLELASNTTLIINRGVTLEAADGLDDGLLYSSSDNVEIIGFGGELNGNYANQTSGSLGKVIEYSGVSDGRVEGVRGVDCGFGIAFVGCTDCVARGNVLSVREDGVALTGADGCKAIENDITYIDSGDSIAPSGIEIDDNSGDGGSTDCLARGNTVRGFDAFSGANSIHVFSHGWDDVHSHRVVNNTIYQVEDTGSDAAGVRVQTSGVDGSGSCFAVDIRGNDIVMTDSHAQVGVAVRSSDPANVKPSNVRIRENLIRFENFVSFDPHNAVELYEGSKIVVEGNIFKDIGYRGVHLPTPSNDSLISNVTIRNNTFDNVRWGVYWNNTANPNPTDVLIKDNDMEGCNSTITPELIDNGCVRLIDNDGNDDFVSTQPTNPEASWRYFDDGTNVSGSSAPAEGVYDGSVWVYSTFDTASV